MAEAFKLHQAVFGSIIPSNLLQGADDTEQKRQAELARMLEQVKMIKNDLEQFRNKFPIKFFVYHSDDKNEQGEKLVGAGRVHAQYFVSIDIASCFSVIRDQAIRHWNLNSLGTDYIGSESNPFNLFQFGVPMEAFLTTCKLLSPHHYKVNNLTKPQVKECDEVVRLLALDQNRPTYFYRSRQGDQTHSSYKINVQQETKISIDEENVTYERDWKKRIVIVKERFIGKTCKSFEFVIPDDVVAVKRFRVQYDYFGASLCLNHLSDVHQSCIEISNEHVNEWFTDIKIEEFNEDSSKMQGYKDVLANASGGHTIQLWLMTNGYAFTRNIDCEMEVYTKIE